jgi:hypothetical protein
MKRYFVFLFSLLISSFSLEVFSQVDPRVADEYFKGGNYLKAVPEYVKLLKTNPSNQDYLLNLSYCYLNLNDDKTRAIPFLEMLVGLDKFDKTGYLFLGMAYIFNYEYDKALEVLERYKKEGVKKQDIDDLERLIKDCHTAKELMRFPLDISIENLGEQINTEFPDYYPFVTKDDSLLIFTSRRKDGKGKIEFDGYYPSDIWFSKRGTNGFTKAQQLKSLNTPYDEQVVGMTDFADTLFIYIDHIEEYGNIYYSELKKGKYTRRKIFDESLNSNGIETSASISPDGNTLFFSSIRKGGKGGTDIYMTRRLPTGEWALPQNLGDKINTPMNEDFPSLSGDGRTLYFSSDGHPGMGGYDLYKSVWDPETNTWSEPVNLGYPINTPEDDRNISFTGDGKYAYVSGFKKDKGLGDLDIYRITFNDVANPPAIFLFSIFHQGKQNKPILDALVTVYDENDDKIGDFNPNQKTGRYTIPLKQGSYMMEIETSSGDIHEEKIFVSEMDIEREIVTREVILPN